MSVDHRCPECDAVVVDVHECTVRWEDPGEGRAGSETTRCEVVNGRMLVSVSGESRQDALHLALALGGAAEAFLMGREADPADIPLAEREGF